MGGAVASAIAAATFAMFGKSGGSGARPLDVFDAVWQIVNENYYDASFEGVDWRAAREQFRPRAETASNAFVVYPEAIWPMLGLLQSSHIYAFPPDNARPQRGYSFEFPAGATQRGAAISFAPGVGTGSLGGVAIAHDGERFVVVDVLNGSAPEKLGVEPGSIVVHFSMPPGSSQPYRAILEFARARGDAIPQRAEWEFTPAATPPFASSLLPSGIALARFDRFDAENCDWALEQVGTASSRGLILDLRTNTGGTEDQVARVASALLADGLIVQSAVQRNRTPVVRRTARSDRYQGPVAVLVGMRTASAAEMFAAALQEHHRAIIVGERTAGAVLAAPTYPLPDGGRLTIPTWDIRTPSGKRLEGVGVMPDIHASPTLIAIREGRDLIVEAAEEALLSQVDRG